MFVKTFAALCAAATLVSAGAQVPNNQPPTSNTFTWGTTKIRGVNLGGWLVLEPWITPSIFQKYPATGAGAVVDEYTLGQVVGQQAAYTNVLKPHWDSWVTLADFQKIAKSGFNMVRIPIGFWAYDNAGTPYVSGSAPYLDTAIGWARQVGVKVIIDLHGAPGSQNGFDNSGQRTKNFTWTQGNTIQRTLAVLQTIQSKYGAASYDDVVIGIELVNEPFTPSLNLNTVKQFYRSGYAQQRTVSANRVVVLQDGFQQDSYWNGFLTPQDNNAQNVALDHHEYQVFDNSLVALAPWQHRQLVCNNAGAYSGADKWTFVGEWSAAMTDCAYALNGYGIGARYDGTYPGSSYVGSCTSKLNINLWDGTMKNDTRGYIEAQLDTFEHYTQGWTFWNVSSKFLAPYIVDDPC